MTAIVEGIDVDVREHIATITLDRPAKLNALTSAMMDTLPTLVDDLATDEGVRCIVLTGRGRAFCAGGDLATLDGNDRRSDDELVARKWTAATD